MSKVRRFQVHVVAVLFALSVSMQPRKAYAVLPIAVPLIAAAYSGVGSISFGSLLGTAVHALIGGTIMFLAITPQIADAPEIRIPTTTSANNPTFIPPPSATASMPATMAITMLFNSVVYSGPDKMSVCSQIMVPPVGEGPHLSPDQTSCYGYHVGYIGVQVHEIATGTTFQTAYSCPSGYTLSGQTCNLSNARQATADQKVDVTRSGTTMTVESDKDTPTNPVVRSTTTATNDTVKVSGTHDGKPVTVAVQALSTGGSLVTTDRQMVDANGQTYVNRTVIQVGVDGKVTSATSVNNSAVLSGNATTQAYDYTTTTAGTANVAPTTAPLEFPSDYARSGEAASAAQTVVNALNPGAMNAPPLAVPAEVQDAQKTLIEGLTAPEVYSFVPSLLPGGATACEPIVFRGKVDRFGWDASENLDLCGTFEVIRMILGYLFGLGAVIYIWRRFSNLRGAA